MSLVRTLLDALPLRRSDHGRILSGMIRVAFFVFAAKLFGAAKEMAVAARFGTGEPVDAYLLVFRVFDLPITVWQSALNVTFIPLLFLLADRPEERMQFRRELLGWTIVGGALLGLAAALAAPLLLSSAGIGAPPSVLQLAAKMALPLALIIPIGIVMAVIFARLMAAERHIASFLDGTPALCLLILLLVVPYPWPSLLVWGTVVGFGLNLVFLLAAQRRFEPIEIPALSFKAQSWPGFARICLVVTAADFVLNLTGVTDQMMVAHLGGGAIATLGYANRIVALVLGLGATAIARATLPVLSDLRGRASDEEVTAVAFRWVRTFFALGVAAVAIGWFGAPFAVKLLFQRGAFTAADTAAVAEVMRYGLFQVPFYFASIIFAQLRAAHGRYLQFLFINVFNVAVKLISTYVLIGYFGVKGAMLGGALMYASSMLISWRLAVRK